MISQIIKLKLKEILSIARVKMNNPTLDEYTLRCHLLLESVAITVLGKTYDIPSAGMLKEAVLSAAKTYLKEGDLLGVDITYNSTTNIGKAILYYKISNEKKTLAITI